MKLLSRYADWTRRRGGTLQCSPALGVLAALVVSGAVIYVYREVILTTLITAAIAAVSVAVFGFAVTFTVSTLRWYRKRQRLMAADPSGGVALATAEVPAATLSDVEAISREADELAEDGMELVFTSDGSLKAKRP